MRRQIRILAISLIIAVSAFGTSRDFWHELMLGNERYVAGHLAYNHLRAQRNSHLTSQYPPVTVLSCADSRVPPELIFDHTIGEIFVVRVAGNVTDDFPLASIEYAVLNRWTKMIVVMGHQDCGAVKTAITGTPEPLSDPLEALLKRIRANIKGEKDLKVATEMNARASAKYLYDNSKLIRDAVDHDNLKIVPAYYSFDGKVTALAP
jgi:carbonic anhydrase